MFVSKDTLAFAASALAIGLLAAPLPGHAVEDTGSSASSASADAEQASGTAEPGNEAEGADATRVYAPARGESGVDGMYGLNEKVLRERARRAFGVH